MTVRTIDPLTVDHALASIDRMRKKLQADFDRAMAKLDKDERDLLGLRAHRGRITFNALSSAVMVAGVWPTRKLSA